MGRGQGGATGASRAEPEAREVASSDLLPSHSQAKSRPGKGDPELRAEVGGFPVPQLPSLWAPDQGAMAPCPCVPDSTVLKTWWHPEMLLTCWENSL